ncbi:MAG: UDP-N-acetylmuramate dehydrogenase [Patescibacteria group bacterium]|nr:UDP-N-acetylmuramate dehydrogenase [Patescibacteria group bacterium]
MLKIQEYVDISDFTTFKVGGKFRYFIELSDIGQLVEVYKFAKEKNLPIRILGGGSNMVFSDGVLDIVALRIEFLGFDIVDDTEKFTDIKIGAGENWDFVVARTVDMGLSGIEALSAIPGSAGATPVQNVGAYGQEIKDTLVSVDVFDIKEGIFKSISNEECNFSYRSSIFKESARGKYVITAIYLRLLKRKYSTPNYPGVKKYFIDNNINNPTLAEVRNAIIEIRKNKLPNPKEIPNVGSFFKNPIVKKELADNLKRDNSSLVVYPVDNEFTKIPAGWLIENSGLKGQNFGSISVYKNNALVLVNNGKASFADVEKVKNEIIEKVYNTFGIRLETEPEFV